MTCRILLDLGKLKTLYSGLGQFSLYYGRYISKIQYSNLIWHFLTPAGFIKKFGYEWEYEKLSFIRRHFPYLCKKYDLWHAIHQDSAYFPGDEDTPYILTIHDLNFLEEKNRLVSFLRLRNLQKKVDKASYITFISHYTEGVAKKNLRINQIPSAVIYNGVDIETEKEVNKPDFLPDGKFLFSIGMILEKKNFHVLVEMMTRLPDLNLIIAGDKSDHYANRIEKEINKHNLTNRIILPGIISHDDKIFLYRNCEAFLFPSKMEGFGLPIIEAMRFGKPVFSSTYASLPEIGGELAYYWDNFEPEYMSNVFLGKMKSFKKEEKELSEKIYKYSKRFNWEESIKKYTSVYVETIRKHCNKDFELEYGDTPDNTEKVDRSLRVLHLSSEKSWRGGEQQIAYLINELNPVADNFIACRKDSDFEKYCKKKGWDHYSLNFKNPFDLDTARKIAIICNKHSIDILHLHTSLGHTLGVLSTYFGHQARLVLSRRVDFPIKRNALSRWKYNHRRIEKILSVSHAIKAILNDTLENQQVCETVHSGIDIKRFDPGANRNTLRKEYDIDKNTIIIGNTSALAGHKDYPTFINTAEYVINKGMNVMFFIIGRGADKRNIEKYINEKGLHEKIILTGFRKDIEKIIPELDIFFMPSKTEGLGTSILDAFASNVPVVATRAGGIPEMVIHEKTGLLSNVMDYKDLGENIIRLINDPGLRSELTKNARELLLQEFTKEKTAQQTYNAYLKITHM